MHPIGEAKGRLQSHERGGRIRRIRALAIAMLTFGVSLAGFVPLGASPTTSIS